ncbi:protein yellow [Eupeodes corollae]|uniref:protein yellow n=1 Tax=Eupeodes corollae TaxID=290404 RepID=UPI00248FFC25|nr:protein yellow [Eupeodes corollae]
MFVERYVCRSPIMPHQLRLGVLLCCWIGIGLLTLAACNDNLRVAYEWKEIDFKYPSKEQKQLAIESYEFIPENVIPVGLEVYRSRLFVTLPRWREGVPASLAYLDLNDNTTKSPALIPFPSWEAHDIYEPSPELVSPFRIRADRCGRLWVLDSRISNILEKPALFGPSQLLVYDLHNDNLLRKYVFPKDHMKEKSFFANIAIEDGDCDNTFAYASDLAAPGLVVYSWKSQESWRVHHNFFHPDPLSGNYSIGGINFQWDDGLFGLSLSKAQPDGYATLYFHPLSSTMEFSVSTMILRDKTLATSNQIYKEFKILGSRGPNAQAGAAFLDQLTGVLFYALPNLNAVACWKTSNRAYTIKSQGRVYMSPVEMVFPNDVKVDDQDRLWVLSDRLHEFIYSELDPDDFNFRILTAHVKDAIENTACDIKTKPLPDLINKLGDILRPNRTVSSAGNMFVSQASLLVVGILLRRFLF